MLTEQEHSSRMEIRTRSSQQQAKPRLPPRWLMRFFWFGHRRVYRWTGGRLGLWPAWWLNLQANPDVQVDVADGPRLVTGRAALGEERERLWTRWGEIDKNLDAYAERRPTGTAVVVFEPRQT